MMCSREGCQKFATKRPVWSFASKVAPNGPRIESTFDIGVCDEHATPDGFLPVDESWQRIEEGMRYVGLALPDRSTFRLTYVAFDAIDPAARELLGGSPTAH